VHAVGAMGSGPLELANKWLGFAFQLTANGRATNKNMWTA